MKRCSACGQRLRGKFKKGDVVFDKLSRTTASPETGTVVGKHILNRRAYMLSDGRLRFANQLRRRRKTGSG